MPALSQEEPELFATLNRSQVLVLVFFGAVWAVLLGILILAPGIYAGAMRAAPSMKIAATIGLFLFVTALIAVLAAGVVRRSRWAYWLIVVAFLAGVLRPLASLLELTGKLRTTDPSWYVLLQAGIGLIQFAIAAALLAGYRKSGVWGAF